MKKILLLSFMLLLTFSFSALAQERTVTGTVTSAKDGTGLPGVNVILKGTNTGAITDIDGKYSVTVPSSGGVLQFSFIGLKSEEREIGARSVIDIAMEENVETLSEVVVTGYGSTTEPRSSISSVTVDSKAIVNRPQASIVQRLNGVVAGLSITTANGQPGGNSLVNLRGISSINGDTEPLFIIDGAPVNQDNFRSINPNEIESVSVLKDAGATAIYGNRGANGVIIITTKRGNAKPGEVQVNYSYQWSTSGLQDNDYDLMDSQEQFAIENEVGRGRGASLSDSAIAAAPTTDWADYFFSEGVAHNHNLTISTAGANSNTFVSFGYLDQEGILQASTLERFSSRVNHSIRGFENKLNVGINLSVNYSDSEEPNSIGTSGVNQNFVIGAYQSLPYITPDDYIDGADLVSQATFANTPLFLIDKLNTFTRTEDEIKIVGSFNASYEIVDGLTARFIAAGDYQDEKRLTATGPGAFNALFFAQTGNTTPGSQTQSTNRQFTYNQVTSLGYTKSFGESTISAAAFTEYFRADLQSFGFTNNGLDPATFFPGDGSGFVPDNAANDFFANTVTANILRTGLFSYFFNADYDYDDKFGVNGTFRRDASSRFAESNRWGTFYSIAGRWNIHRESFAQGLPFDVLKLRASYGETGNQDISAGGTFGSPDLTRDLFVTGGGYRGFNSLALGQIGNSTLRWETVAQTNIGLDIETFNNKLRIVTDFYIKTTSDLFQSTPISAINGQTAINANIGELENKGVDLTVDYDLFRATEANGLNFTLKFVGNYNATEIKSLPGGEEELIGTGRVGGRLFEYFNYRYAGVNPANGNLLFLTADGDLTENPNPDTDRVWLDKNIYPDFQGSFGFDLDYKGFFASIQFTYTVGVDRYDVDLSNFQRPQNIGQFRTTRDLQRAWNAEDNRVTDIPSLNAGNLTLGQGGSSDRYLTSADYVRLRFAQVGYNLPFNLVEKAGLRSARIFLNGENLVTFSEWRGFDPEALSNTSRLYPTARTWSVGLDLNF